MVHSSFGVAFRRSTIVPYGPLKPLSSTNDRYSHYSTDRSTTVGEPLFFPVPAVPVRGTGAAYDQGQVSPPRPVGAAGTRGGRRERSPTTTYLCGLYGGRAASEGGGRRPTTSPRGGAIKVKCRVWVSPKLQRRWVGLTSVGLCPPVREDRLRY